MTVAVPIKYLDLDSTKNLLELLKLIVRKNGNSYFYFLFKKDLVSIGKTTFSSQDLQNSGLG